MKELVSVQDEIMGLVGMWEMRLHAIDRQVLHGRRNGQGRTIQQIVGHLADSASNNLHRIVHLQYQASPLQFPDYANLGNNDRWIAIQRYQEEDWQLLVQLWKFSNLHLAHVIGHVAAERLGNVWISALGDHITLLEMIVDYPRHLKLHLGEIAALLQESGEGAVPGSKRHQGVDSRQVQHYQDKLAFEIDAWDLAEWQRRDSSVVIIDARPELAYSVEHIVGAVSLPHRNMNEASTRELDPGKVYVTYCDGIGCNASTKGALKLAELGFATRELIGGLEWWKRDGYPTEGSRKIEVVPVSCNCG